MNITAILIGQQRDCRKWRENSENRWNGQIIVFSENFSDKYFQQRRHSRASVWRPCIFLRRDILSEFSLDAAMRYQANVFMGWDMNPEDRDRYRERLSHLVLAIRVRALPPRSLRLCLLPQRVGTFFFPVLNVTVEPHRRRSGTGKNKNKKKNVLDRTTKITRVERNC